MPPECVGSNMNRQVWRFWQGQFERQSAYGETSQEAHPTTVSPYGQLPYQQAGGVSSQFTNPLSAFFGIAPPESQGKRFARYQAQMGQIAGSDSPLAQYMRQAGTFLPQVFGQAQDVGSRIASMAPGLFDMLRQQIGGAMGALPGIQGQAGQGAQMAGQAAEQAFSPIASQALFQNALRGSLESSRAGAGARGLLDAGGAQAQEDVMTRDLAAQYAQNQFANQQAALGGQQQALGTQAGLLQMGPQFAQQLSAALPGLQQALMAGYQTPMDALQQVFQQFAAYQNPQLALLGLTTPQVGTTSEGGGFNIIGSGVSEHKYPVVYWVGYN